MSGIRRCLVGLALAGVLAGCTPYDPPNKPYAVDSYLDPPKAIYDYHAGDAGLTPSPARTSRSGSSGTDG